MGSGCCLFSTTAAASWSKERWKARQVRDSYAHAAKVQGLKSRAAFKLLEMDARYHLFKAGQTVVDLGYAPGSWSQVALERTKPSGRVLGIDLIPVQPPRGVSTIQGNFLSPAVRAMAKDFLATSAPAPRQAACQGEENDEAAAADDVVLEQPSYFEMERQPSPSDEETASDGRLVDVVLSDMSEPWPQTYGFWLNTLSNPYARLMNTTGIPFRDHAGSMDLCYASLTFANDTLRTGGHLVCKFYQGREDKDLEALLKQLFATVHREKPKSSRSESKEAYFVALKRKKDVFLDL